MEQIASASVKCAVTEENKATIKRALSREFEFDIAGWKGDEINFKKESFDTRYQVQINIDVLPDLKGYSIGAQICKKEPLWWFLFVILSHFVCSMVVGDIIVLFFFLKVLGSQEITGFMGIMGFVGGSCLFWISGTFFDRYRDFSIKRLLNQAFEQAFNGYNRS